MRRYLQTLVFLAIIVAAARTVDLLFFTDWVTGFVTQGSIYIRVAVAISVVFFGYFTGTVRRRNLKEIEYDIESGNSSMERTSVISGICFFLTGFATAASSVGVFYTMYMSGEITYLSRTSEELLNMGRSKLYYILVVASIVLGVFVAFWFLLVGSWYFRGEGHFAGGRYISILVIIWYYIRVIKDFLKFPINPNNTTSLFLLLSILSLALFYTKYTKVISIDFPLIEDPPLFGFGGLTFLWILGIGAPTMLILFTNREIDQIVVMSADVMAAISALSSLYARLPKKRRRNVQKQT